MRKLGLKDAFALARIIKAANIRDEIAAFGLEVRELQKAEKSANVEEIGIKFLITVATAISDEKIEKQFYSSLTGPAILPYALFNSSSFPLYRAISLTDTI